MPGNYKKIIPGHYKKTVSKSMHTINKEDPQCNETLLRPVSEDK